MSIMQKISASISFDIASVPTDLHIGGQWLAGSTGRSATSCPPTSKAPTSAEMVVTAAKSCGAMAYDATPAAKAIADTWSCGATMNDARSGDDTRFALVPRT